MLRKLILSIGALCILFAGIFIFTISNQMSDAKFRTLNTDLIIPKNVNHIPFYGNTKKTAEMLKADEEFMQIAIRESGSVEEASLYFSDKAWVAFQKRNLNEAMARANQAWLLDKNNAVAYWVMALIQDSRGAEQNEVEALFKKNFEHIDSANKGRLENDYQTFLTNISSRSNSSMQNLLNKYNEAVVKLTTR